MSGSVISLSMKSLMKNAIETKLDLLIKSDLVTGYALLYQAKDSIDTTVKSELLINAVVCLNSAISKSVNYTFFYSYFGLIMCYEELGEKPNLNKCFEEFITSSVAEKVFFTETNSNLYFNKYTVNRAQSVFEEVLSKVDDIGLSNDFLQITGAAVAGTGLIAVTTIAGTASVPLFTAIVVPVVAPVFSAMAGISTASASAALVSAIGITVTTLTIGSIGLTALATVGGIVVVRKVIKSRIKKNDYPYRDEILSKLKAYSEEKTSSLNNISSGIDLKKELSRINLEKQLIEKHKDSINNSISLDSNYMKLINISLDLIILQSYCLATLCQ